MTRHTSYTRHVPYVAWAPRIFFWRVNNHIAYTAIVLTAYFLTAQILFGTADLMGLSDAASQNQVVDGSAHSSSVPK